MKKIISITFFVLIIIALFVFLYSFPLPFETANTPVFKKLPCKTENKKIVFVSDTQMPIPVETIFLSGNRNKLARDLIFKQTLKENPAAVFHLGDLTEFSYSNKAWRKIDDFVGKLNRSGTGFYPTLGNHEYLLYPQKGIKNFSKRFPYVKTCYSVRCGNAEIILFNSNFSKLSEKEFEKEKSEYRKLLEKAEKDPRIKTVIVATHYPPFTNSKLIFPNKSVQRHFLPDFYKTKKAKLFVSGHAHACEHFNRNGKDFLVIGGGGGLLQPLYSGNNARFTDLFDDKSPKRMYHFLEIIPGDEKLEVKIIAVKKDFSGFETKYDFEIPVK